jgi:hypothetical protein
MTAFLLLQVAVAVEVVQVMEARMFLSQIQITQLTARARWVRVVRHQLVVEPTSTAAEAAEAAAVGTAAQEAQQLFHQVAPNVAALADHVVETMLRAMQQIPPTRQPHLMGQVLLLTYSITQLQLIVLQILKRMTFTPLLKYRALLDARGRFHQQFQLLISFL